MGCAQPSESATPPADPPAGCQRCRFPSWPGATLKQPLKRGLPRKGTQNKSTPSSTKLIDCGLEPADSDVDLGEIPKRGRAHDGILADGQQRDRLPSFSHCLLLAPQFSVGHRDLSVQQFVFGPLAHLALKKCPRRIGIGVLCAGVLPELC